MSPIFFFLSLLNISPNYTEYTKKLCINADLLSPTNTYLLIYEHRYFYDLCEIYDTYLEVKNYPNTHEINGLPDDKIIEQNMLFQLKYLNYIESQLDYYTEGTSQYNDIINIRMELKQLIFLWDLIRDCKIVYYHIRYKRRALNEYREKVGDFAYYNGILPPVVPYWRFQKLD